MEHCKDSIRLKQLRSKRFLTLGMAGLERDAPRPGRTPKINASLIRRVVNLTTRQKPPNATHWSTRSMARAVGISQVSVRRIWHSHGLKPHRIESFKISNIPSSRKNWKISSACI